MLLPFAPKCGSLFDPHPSNLSKGVCKTPKINMKKLTLTSVCALAMTGAAFAQGEQVAWNVISPAAMTAQSNNSISPLFGGPGGGASNGAIPTTAGAFYFELLYNTAFTGSRIAEPSLVDLTDGSWIDTGLEAENSTTSAGKLV